LKPTTINQLLGVSHVRGSMLRKKFLQDHIQLEIGVKVQL